MNEAIKLMKKMKDVMALVEENFNRFADQEVKAAAKEARKGLQEIKNLSKELRLAITEAKKKMGKKKKK